MINSKLKTIKLLYIVFFILYCIVLFFALFFCFGVCLITENVVSIILMILNITRIIFVFVLLLKGLSNTNSAIMNDEYLDKYMRNYSFIKGIIATALLSPVFIYFTISRYRLSQLYVISNIDNENISNIKKPISKTTYLVLIIISSLLSVLSAFGYCGTTIYIETFRGLNSSINEAVKPKEDLPSIRIHYGNNEMDLFDQNFNFDYLDKYMGDNMKDINPDTTVKAKTHVMGYTNGETQFNLELYTDKKCKVKEMKIKDMRIRFIPYKHEYYSPYDEQRINEFYNKVDSYYIIINGTIINKDTSYNIVREIIKQLSKNEMDVHEYTYNDYKSLNYSAYPYYELNFSYTLDDKLESIHINTRSYY